MYILIAEQMIYSSEFFFILQARGECGNKATPPPTPGLGLPFFLKKCLVFWGFFCLGGWGACQDFLAEWLPPHIQKRCYVPDCLFSVLFYFILVSIFLNFSLKVKLHLPVPGR